MIYFRNISMKKIGERLNRAISLVLSLLILMLGPK